MLLAKSFDPACAVCQRLYDHRRDLSQDGLPLPPASVRGPREARLLIVDLAPPDAGAEHCSLGSAEELLIDALVAAGFASRAAGRSRLLVARITHAVRCPTPAGGPTVDEMRSCRGYLKHDLAMLYAPGMRRTRCVVALGKLAYASVARAIGVRLPPFEHGVESEPLHHLRVLGCLRPTPRNLDCGHLTPSMLDGIFERCRVLVGGRLPEGRRDRHPREAGGRGGQSSPAKRLKTASPGAPRRPSARMTRPAARNAGTIS